MPVLFVSHASKDDAAAIALEKWLRARGFTDLFIDLQGDRLSNPLPNVILSRSPLEYVRQADARRLGVQVITKGPVIKTFICIIGGALIMFGAASQAQRQSKMFTIHSPPEGGGKCIEVLNPEIRLQMQGCNDMPPQIFSYEKPNGRLMIADQCVDTEGGRGEAGISLPLAPCNGAPSQVWKAEANGDYIKFVGINGLCIAIGWASNENRAALRLEQCADGWHQNWRLVPASEPTYEEKVDRNGHHITEFNLAAPDPRLCRTACGDNRQCTAWVYRKPEGRTDDQPHCWLLDKTTKVDQGDPMLISGTVRPETQPLPR